MYVMCFVLKQKTAYDMRISDWSSDVCSSDLLADRLLHRQIGLARARGTERENDVVLRELAHIGDLPCGTRHDGLAARADHHRSFVEIALDDPLQRGLARHDDQRFDRARIEIVPLRSEERRVGKECVSTYRSRWTTYH